MKKKWMNQHVFKIPNTWIGMFLMILFIILMFHIFLRGYHLSKITESFKPKKKKSSPPPPPPPPSTPQGLSNTEDENIDNEDEADSVTGDESVGADEEGGEEVGTGEEDTEEAPQQDQGGGGGKKKKKKGKKKKKKKKKKVPVLPRAAIDTITSMINLGQSIGEEIYAIMNMGKDFTRATRVKLPNEKTPDMAIIQTASGKYVEPVFPEAKV